MARNKVQFQKGMSEAHFDELYGTEPLCHAALVRWRWPKGFQCPDCECRGHCIVKRGTRSLYQCNACRKQTSVKAGTIFACSKLPLRLWFKAMYLITQSKKGISSIELGRRLGVTQTTAWTLKHKLAQVMPGAMRPSAWRAKCKWTTPISAASTRERSAAARRGKRLSWPP
jgi:transposase-like protein